MQFFSLTKLTICPDFFKNKGWISKENQAIIDEWLKKEASDTYMTVLKMKKYKLKMRLVVNRRENQAYKVSFKVLHSNDKAFKD